MDHDYFRDTIVLEDSKPPCVELVFKRKDDEIKREGRVEVEIEDIEVVKLGMEVKAEYLSFLSMFFDSLVSRKLDEVLENKTGSNKMVEHGGKEELN